MAAWWWGWPHRARGDREDVPRRPYATASSRESAELVAVPLSRVLSSSFEGHDMEVREYAAGDHVWFEDRWMVASWCDE
jgi:hypothetical protein